jgi:hypothetical protein
MRLFFLVALVGCVSFGTYYYVTISNDISEIIVDDSLMPFYEEWKKDMHQYDIDYSNLKWLRKIVVSDYMSDITGGISSTWFKKIQINSRCFEYGYWYTKYVVYHELGHYVFNMNHGSCYIMKSGFPADEENLSTNWKIHLEEYVKVAKSSVKK